MMRYEPDPSKPSIRRLRPRDVLPAERAARKSSTIATHRMPIRDQITLNAIRTYLEENLPDSAQLDEKSMFGCNCFMVRGHIFIAMKYDGSRILVRVGKDAMEKAEELEGASRGPIQGMWVNAPHFKGNDNFSVWYELAAAFNARQDAKECDEAKPGRKRRRDKQRSSEG